MIHCLRNLLVLILLANSLSSQHLNSIKYGKEEVNLYAGITGIFEDSDGFLWVHGFDGVVRYDGLNFTALKDLYPETALLPTLNCYSLHKSPEYLWLGTSTHGIFTINQKGRVNNFNRQLESEDTLVSTRITKIKTYEDHLFVLGNKGLESFSKSGHSYAVSDLKIQDPSSIVDFFIHDKQLWYEDQEGLHLLHLIDGSIEDYPSIRQVKYFPDQEGQLWIAHRSEGTNMSQFDTVSKKWINSQFQPYKNYKKERNFAWYRNKQLFSCPRVDLYTEVSNFDEEKKARLETFDQGLIEERFLRQPFLDSKGGLWLYGQELYLIPPESVVSTEYYGPDEGVINDIVIAEDFRVIALRNQGLIVENHPSGETKKYTKDNSMLADNFISVIEDLGNGRLGICMMNNFQIYDLQSGFEAPIELSGISRSAYENDNFLWIGTFKSVIKINKRTKERQVLEAISLGHNAGNPTHAIFELSQDQMLFVTANSGILKPLPRNNESMALSLPGLPTADLLSSARINAASLSPSKDWIATASDKGINLYSSDDLSKSLLTSEFSINVIFLDDTTLYATSQTEIIRIDLKSKQISTFGRRQGACNTSYSLRSSYKDASGNIYFGGNRGIDKVSIKHTSIPPFETDLLLDQVKFNGIAQFPNRGTEVKIPSDVKVVEFKLANPRGQSSSSQNLQSKIPGTQEWSALPSNSSFVLYNPPPGKQEVTFRIIDDHGVVKTEELSIKMQVLRKWYLNPISWVLAGLALLLVAFASHSRFQKNKNLRIQKNLKLKEELATLKLTSLNSQMNPHFIFNALSSIQQLIASGESEIAETYLSKFSKLLRHVIQYAAHKEVSLQDEEQFIRNYLDLELLRFENSFEYQIHNKVENSEKIYIPPFFVQPQIENAIKHGLLNQKKKGNIEVVFLQIGHSVQITVEDNGVGRKHAEKNNIYHNTNTKKGNLLVSERIKNLNDLNYESSYQIKDLVENQEASGTRVTLTFPLNQISK